MKYRKFLLVLIILAVIVQVGRPLPAAGLEELANKTVSGILDFFKDKYNARTAVIKFENYSGLSESAAQKFYQLLVSKIEPGNKHITFHDLMINFSLKEGQFDLSRLDKLNYLIYIKLIRNREKIGAGAAIFSTSTDRIVSIKYAEEVIPVGEREILINPDFGFGSTGFARVMEIEADIGLLDFMTIKDAAGEERYYFYYPEKLDIYRVSGNNLTKAFSFKLKWGRPYFPVLKPEGKLGYFYQGEVLKITLAGNFAPYAKVFSYKNNQWEEGGKVNFVPLQYIKFNNSYYLAGARYDEGKNSFEGRVLLAPIDSSGQISGNDLYEKAVPPFYAIAFACQGDVLDSIHLIDRDYRYRFLAADFNEWTVEDAPRGGSLSALSGNWLAVADYSRGNDKLFFYRIGQGSRQLVYEEAVKGEIVFISAGTWKSQPGFWVYLQVGEVQESAFRLQFWGKTNE